MPPPFRHRWAEPGLRGILVERTENKNLTATITPADQAPDLAGIWARLADKPKPQPEVYPIPYQPEQL